MSEETPRWSAAPGGDGWVDEAEDPRLDDDGGNDERSILRGYLRAYRLTLAMKCEGLDAEQLARRSVPPSTMSLLGLVRHLAKVEQIWSRRVLAAEVAAPLFPGPDADWDGAVADPSVVEDAFAAWRAEIAFAEARFEEEADLGRMARTTRGEPVAVRDVLIHLIEEYARHAGHADLLRERIDGRVGH